MIYKLPDNERALPPHIKDRLEALKLEKSYMIFKGKQVNNKREEWDLKFIECNKNKKMLDGLTDQIDSETVPQDKYTDTVAAVKRLEDNIAIQENELLQMLNEPVDKTAIEKAQEKAQQLSGQGSVNIRPPKGVYSAPKQRK